MDVNARVKEDRSQISNLHFHFEELGKRKKKNKPRATQKQAEGRKEGRLEWKFLESRTTEKSMKPKIGSLKRSSQLPSL